MSDYDCFAQLYHWEHRNFADDLVLYRNFALRCHAPGGAASVLDVGCGSGRVALSLAADGIAVVGVDNSAAMLDLARAQAVELGLSERVQFVEQDVVELALEPQFAMALFALNGFLHLTTVEAQRAALKNLFDVLLPGGFLLVDVPNPHTVFTAALDGQMMLRGRFASPEGVEIWCFQNAQTDLAAQTQHLTLMYDRVLSPQAVQPAQIERTLAQTEVRFVYCCEMENLLTAAGFVVDNVYGSYDLDPYEADSHQMLFVAYKPMV
ncbi:MAG: methyltransferase domain-containing protein [Anaerolineae bacterium]|nr:methyltransferase domain-containing protein [Anaerolineae bacterium]